MTELSDADALDIVQRLISRTQEGALTWDVWESGIYEYFAASPRFRYYVKTRDNDGTAPYDLQIYRVQNSASEYSGSAEPAPTEEISSYPLSPYSESVERLYKMARSRALGVENLKSDIFEDLAGE